ncbi:MAG TPA: glycosyltransferase [Thermoguttaceae bacterium]|nr:glycosyltransferase [Thermoguttaceae bacterium]
MIWLASFPRSGSTFLRIVLDEVYGIESSTFHREEDYPVDEDYADYPVVKTHLLPEELVPRDCSIPAVYLVRDGRDCVVSLAHYRKELIARESDFEVNLREAIEASEGSHFGGWSEHVRRWSARASLTIRFEDLIADPLGCVEQLRPWLDLPEPRVERLPGFADLKSKDFKYGSGVQHGFDPAAREHWRTAKFRRGRTGAWQDELPERLHLEFLRLHGAELIRLGYVEPAARSSIQAARATIPQRPHASPHVSPHGAGPRKRRLLIDGSKLLDPRMDGIKRYVQELLRAMVPIVRERQDAWEVHVHFGACGTFRLLDITEDIEQGQPPLSKIPRLFRTDDENPINVYRRRLREGGRGLSWDRARDTVRYNCLKTLRSLHKRRQELAWLRVRLSGRWGAGRSSASMSDYDLVHLTLPNTWSLYSKLDAPLLVTVHDLCHEVCPEFQTASNNRSLGAGLRFARRADSDYVADSHATKEQMVRLLGVDPERVAVVHLACDFGRFQPVSRAEELARVRRKYGIPEGPYVLSVGTLEPRKNVINVVRAFSLLANEAPDLGANLIVAGSFGWGDAGELEGAIRACPRVRAIGYVDDEDLPALYSGAAVFSYVSHYEGFGLPLLEAMACGVPTIYGNVASMPEIAGEAGLPAAPEDVREIKHRLHQLLQDTELRRRLARLAVLRSLDFDWKRAAEETFACYERSIQARSAKAPTMSLGGGDSGSAGPRTEAQAVGGKHAAA